MWCRRVAGFGVLFLCVLVGCSDAPTGDASGIGEVVNDGASNPEEPQSSGPAPVTETKTDMLLSAIVTAAEDNAPLPEAKDDKDKKKAEAARVAQEAVDLSEALQAVALRAQVDGNGKPIILDFHGRYLTDDGLAKLKGQVTLQQLFLSQQSGISDIGLEHLKGLTALRTLSLSETPIGDSNLEALSSLKALQQLDLSGTKVSSAGLEHIKTLTALVELKLAQSPVTDSGLAHLKPLSK
ncbi:MAG: leucine-rich repeat domain-containing protein, partial [Planctomycetota bacterium]|nr:leucine-rich repeat domain-containing protein [Planctomycetota bacterium]